MKILVTGSAGFIGFHLCHYLLKNKKYKVYGIDNINNYYDIKLKKDRLKILNKSKNFNFFKIDITNSSKIENNFKKNKYDVVVNLAAQAGVRNSIKEPKKYLNSNINGFFNILENSNKYKIKHFLFASTSSVYGSTKNFPIKEVFSTDKPLSFYAATKKCNEIMAYSYSHIHNLKCTSLRFFTVFGPYGRPDMALFKFVSSILNNKKIDLFNYGKHERDFTYVDDVVKSIAKLLEKKNKMKFNVFNIGSNRPVKLIDFVKKIKNTLNIEPKINYLPLQLGDVYKTHADNTKIKNFVGDFNQTSVDKGIKEFIRWFIKYYK